MVEQLRLDVLMLLLASYEGKSFLGIGWGFPPNFRKDSGDITMVSDEEDIRQSLMIYFNTKTNERIMRPDYGCVLHDLQFERVNSEIIESLIFEIKIILDKLSLELM